MQCPNCQTENVDGSRFCISCGQSLNEAASGTVVPTPIAPSRSAAERLGVATAQAVLGLLGLWLLMRVLLRLSFLRELRFPDVAITGEEIVRSLVFLVAILVLLSFANTLRRLWAAAFPAWRPLTSVLVGLIYVLALSMLFTAVRAPLTELVDDSDLILAVRTLLAVAALVLLATAWIRFYRTIPNMFQGRQFTLRLEASETTTCPHCGRVHYESGVYCMACGKPLQGEAAAA